MSQKSYIEAPDSLSIYNATQSGTLRQIQPGEKRISGPGRETGSKTPAVAPSPRRGKRRVKRAKIVSQDGNIVVVFE